jgi:predicted nucleotidyltransferase
MTPTATASGTIEGALARLVSQIVAAVGPLRIILFGSAARGEMREGSDLDLLVVVPDGTHRRHTAQHLYCAVRGIGVPFDLVVATPSDPARYGDAPGLVYATALREGKLLYGA